MGYRDRVTLTISPLLIRLCLALTFLWAGLGKVSRTDFTPEQSAALANMGVATFVSRAVTPVPPPIDDPEEPDETPPAVDEVDEDQPAEPDEPADANDNEQQPADAEEAPGEEPDQARHGETGFRFVLVSNEGETGLPDELEQNDKHAEADHAIRTYTADDFPKGVRAHRLYSVALSLKDTRLEPYAGYLAWMAALTELIGGLMLIPGILARVWGLGLAITMGVALWLTTITPSLGDPNAFLGFWPNIAPEYGSPDWLRLVTGFWQLALGTMALSIFISGAGRLSIDSLFFGPQTTPRKPAKKAKSD